MNPKEKAEELVEEMSKQTYSFQKYAGANYSVEEIGWEAGKQCALIAVDEVIKSNYKVLSGVKPSFYDYWVEVKQEIEKL
jgi:hypothetical protein